MKIVIGFLILIIGVLASLYFGGWVMFVGGIVQIIEAAKADPVSSLDIALGVGRVLLTGIATGLGVALSIIIGGTVMGMKPYIKRVYRR